ncbi:type VII secretion integral membrane protein EccD [Pseudonocardia sp. D17]|nr:hypothetical protein PSD17_58110 [Pseudonocardia sp. D17]
MAPRPDPALATPPVPDFSATVPLGSDPYASARRQAGTPPVPGSPWCRVTVCAPHRTADVALPTGVPVAELVPMLLDLLGRPSGMSGGPVPWRLATAAGALLPAASSLDLLGVLDGEVLYFAPDVAPPPPPVLDDPVDALARAATPTPGGGIEGAGSVLALLVAGIAAGLLAVAAATGSAGRVPVAVVAALLAVGGVVAAGRRPPDLAGLREARVAALAATGFAAAAGWAALPSGPGGLLLAAAAGGVAAAGGQIVVRVVTPALLAVATISGALVVAATGALLTGAGAAPVAATTAAVALAANALVPRCALRLAGLPSPAVPPIDDDLVTGAGADMSPDELADRADLARGYLTGGVAGLACVAAGGAVVATTSTAVPSWLAALFAALVALVLALRSRGTPDAATVLVLLTTAAVAGLAALLPVAAAGPVGPIVVGLVLVAAAAGLGTRGRVVASPVLRRATDMIEIGLVATTAPLAVAVSGLYTVVHGL